MYEQKAKMLCSALSKVKIVKLTSVLPTDLQLT